MPAPLMAHIGQGDWHELVLLGALFVGPAVLLGIVIVVGRLRGEDEDPEDGDPADPAEA